ncbi:MAG: hypothetical protein IJY10_07815 [Lachnospiraceae bacterium]|nr:hypothetical protein [Lachnospiraceae bacterium]MBQ9123379.1 hypothetical protein [Lachnospiraceae bacterium]
MKKMKRLFAILLAMTMVFSFAACGGNADANGKGDTSSYYAEDGRYPAKTIKIGVPVYDETDSSIIATKAYYDYLDDYLNIEMVYSEALASAEDEIAFIENCAVAGCVAITGSYDVIGSSVLDTVAEYGMYYLMGPADITLMQGELYEQYKNSEYWLGGYTQGNSNYNASKLAAEYLMEKGVKKACYASGGALFGVEMFVAAKNGFYETIQNAGYEMEIVELPGFPSDEWFAAQASILADPTIEAVTGLATPNFWAQALSNAGRDDIIWVCPSGSLDETNLTTFGSGAIDCAILQNHEEFAINLIFLLNALNGDLDVVKPDGTVQLLDSNLWNFASYDDAKELYDMLNGGEHFISAQDILAHIKQLNPNVTFEDIDKLMHTTDLDAVRERHASY